MRILALDSSAVSASVAVMEDEKLVGEFFIHTKQTHSQTLMPMVKNVLDCTDIALDTIDLFAVSAGLDRLPGCGLVYRASKGWQWHKENLVWEYPPWRQWRFLNGSGRYRLRSHGCPSSAGI